VCDLISHDFELGDRIKALEDMRFLEGEVLVPVFYRGDLYAVIVVGSNRDGRFYNDLDLAHLNRLASRAEHLLEKLMSGLTHQQLTAVWAHDLMKPFTSKGSFRWIKEMRDGRFGELPKDVQDILRLMQFDFEWVSGSLGKVIHPSEFDPILMQPNPLGPLCQRVLARYSLLAHESGINFSVDIPPDSARVICNVPMIEHRVLSNLVENALRHTARGGSVHVGYQIEDKKFVGFVRDTGVGMRPEDISKVWEAGVQLDEKNKGVAGLGLFSVKTVVEGHKGKVRVESEPGKGTCFYFELEMAA
jgi:signal transduction histidine kinase